MKNHKKFNELIEESSRCLLCYDPPCSKACPAGKEPAAIIMSLRFKNYEGAYYKAIEYLKKAGQCGKACNNKMYCQRNCIRGKIDRPIKIKIVQESLYKGNVYEEVK
ncbi:hypothetical protein [Clostridium tyrobutyricum]|uniref:hypothetical protein n=1 Tax=Clostridium tyrobutyricum TaxID=1519 RepID=UPI0030CCD6A2